MRCWQCGYGVGDGATFCTSCGVRVSPEDVATTRVRVGPQPVGVQPQRPVVPQGWTKGARSPWIAASIAAVTVSVVVLASVGWWLTSGRGGGEDEALVLEGLHEDSIHEAWTTEIEPRSGEDFFSEQHGTVQVLDEGETVVVAANGESHSIIALEPGTGEVRWSSDPMEDEWEFCRADEEVVVCGQWSQSHDEGAGRVIAFAVEDGAELFRTPWEEDVRDVMVRDGGVFVLESPWSTDDGPEPVWITKYSRTGDELWIGGGRSRVLDAGYPRLSPSDDRIGVSGVEGEDGRHLVFDADSGELVEDRGHGYLAGQPFEGAWSAEVPASEDDYGAKVVAPGPNGPQVMGTGDVFAVDLRGDSRRVGLDEGDAVRMFSTEPGVSRELWFEDGTWMGACEGISLLEQEDEVIARSDEDGRAWTARLGSGHSAESVFCGDDRLLVTGRRGDEERGERSVRMLSIDSGSEVWRASPADVEDVVADDRAASSTGYTEVYASSDGTLTIRRFQW